MFIPNPRFLTDLQTERPYKEAMRGAVQQAADEANKVQNFIMPARGGKAWIQPAEIDGEMHLVNFNHGGHIDEWGSKNNPPYAPLRTGVRRAGFDLIEE
jgi:hypothetical protein